MERSRTELVPGHHIYAAFEKEKSKFRKSPVRRPMEWSRAILPLGCFTGTALDKDTYEFQVSSF
jgi:hypothetical protein